MKILVPLDGSPMAEAALPKALELAKRNEAARIILLRAVDPAALPGRFSATQVAAINEAAAYLDNVAGRLRREGVELVGRSVSYAGAGRAIVEAARAAKPDLIVMVSRGADRRSPGPVAQFVLREARMPILLVAAGTALPAHGRKAA
jgi:nucleotide-binding universal stress UspA family protein